MKSRQLKGGIYLEICHNVDFDCGERGRRKVREEDREKCMEN